MTNKANSTRKDRALSFQTLPHASTLRLADWQAIISFNVVDGGMLMDLAHESTEVAKRRGIASARVAYRELRKVERWWLDGARTARLNRVATPFTAIRMELGRWLSKFHLQTRLEEAALGKLPKAALAPGKSSGPSQRGAVRGVRAIAGKFQSLHKT